MQRSGQVIRCTVIPCPFCRHIIPIQCHTVCIIPVKPQSQNSPLRHATSISSVTQREPVSILRWDTFYHQHRPRRDLRPSPSSFDPSAPSHPPSSFSWGPSGLHPDLYLDRVLCTYPWHPTAGAPALHPPRCWCAWLWPVSGAPDPFCCAFRVLLPAPVPAAPSPEASLGRGLVGCDVCAVCRSQRPRTRTLPRTSGGSSATIDVRDADGQYSARCCSHDHFACASCCAFDPSTLARMSSASGGCRKSQ